jgi:hypothetical protein
MELFYCVIIGILGMMLSYWLGRKTTKNENDKKLQEIMDTHIFQNNKEYREAEMKLRGIKKELIATQEKINDSDVVRDAEAKAESILTKAQTKAERLEKGAYIARKNMLKEIETLRELIEKKVQSFIDGNRPMTAEDNLNSLLRSPKGNRIGDFPHFQE